MSAQLSTGGTAATDYFNAFLQLPDGGHAHLTSPTLTGLAAIVAKLQGPANEGNVVTAVTSVRQQTAAASAPAAAAPAAQGDAENGPAATATPASAPPAAGGSAASAGEAGNAAAASSTPAASAAPAASTSAAAPSFDEVKKVFLTLGGKEGGRAKCEAVLKPFGLARLSEAKPEQYAAVLAALEKAAG